MYRVIVYNNITLFTIEKIMQCVISMITTTDQKYKFGGNYTFLFCISHLVCVFMASFGVRIWKTSLIVTIDRLSYFLRERLNKRDLIYFYSWTGTVNRIYFACYYCSRMANQNLRERGFFANGQKAVKTKIWMDLNLGIKQL